MNLEFTEEQSRVQEAFRKMLKKELPSSLVKELQQPEASGHSEKLWSQLAGDGWLGIAIPEAYDGSGSSILELGILFEEAGRFLVPTTLYSTIYAAMLIESLGTEQQKHFLGGIARGEVISSVAFTEPEVMNNLDCIRTCAHREGDEWVLQGTKTFVSNANLANQILVLAVTNDYGRHGLTVFVVPRTAAGVQIQPHITFGRDRQSVVHLNSVRLGTDSVLGGESAVSQAGPEFKLARQHATALQCVEMVGGMQQIVDMTIKYVSERSQFGKLIGSFQAVQHHMANMATKAAGARLVSYQALWLLANNKPADAELAMAKAWTGEAYKYISLLAHQLWGGMGFAEESDLYLYSNRAKATELSFGTREYHLNQLADVLLSPVRIFA